MTSHLDFPLQIPQPSALFTHKETHSSMPSIDLFKILFTLAQQIDLRLKTIETQHAFTLKEGLLNVSTNFRILSDALALEEQGIHLCPVKIPPEPANLAGNSLTSELKSSLEKLETPVLKNNDYLMNCSFEDDTTPTAGDSFLKAELKLSQSPTFKKKQGDRVDTLEENVTFDNRKNQKFFMESSDTVRIQTQDSFMGEETRISPSKDHKQDHLQQHHRRDSEQNSSLDDIETDLDSRYGVKNAQMNQPHLSNKTSPTQTKRRNIKTEYDGKVNSTCSTVTNRESKQKLAARKASPPLKKKVKTPSFGQVEMEAVVDDRYCHQSESTEYGECMAKITSDSEHIASEDIESISSFYSKETRLKASEAVKKKNNRKSPSPAPSRPGGHRNQDSKTPVKKGKRTEGRLQNSCAKSRETPSKLLPAESPMKGSCFSRTESGKKLLPREMSSRKNHTRTMDSTHYSESQTSRSSCRKSKPTTSFKFDEKAETSKFNSRGQVGSTKHSSEQQRLNHTMKKEGGRPGSKRTPHRRNSLASQSQMHSPMASMRTPNRTSYRRNEEDDFQLLEEEIKEMKAVRSSAVNPFHTTETLVSASPPSKVNQRSKLIGQIMTPDVIDMVGEYMGEFLPGVAFLNRRTLSSFLTYKTQQVGVQCQLFNQQISGLKLELQSLHARKRFILSKDLMRDFKHLSSSSQWQKLSRALQENELGPKDIVILRLYFSFLGKNLSEKTGSFVKQILKFFGENRNSLGKEGAHLELAMNAENHFIFTEPVKEKVKVLLITSSSEEFTQKKTSELAIFDVLTNILIEAMQFSNLIPYNVENEIEELQEGQGSCSATKKHLELMKSKILKY